MKLAVGCLQHVLQVARELWQHLEGLTPTSDLLSLMTAFMWSSQTYIRTQVLTLNLLLERKNLGHLKFLEV